MQSRSQIGKTTYLFKRLFPSTDFASRDKLHAGVQTRHGHCSERKSSPPRDGELGQALVFPWLSRCPRSPSASPASLRPWALALAPVTREAVVSSTPFLEHRLRPEVTALSSSFQQFHLSGLNSPSFSLRLDISQHFGYIYIFKLIHFVLF